LTENNALQGSSFSSPTILTDSEALSFLNDSPLVVYLDHSNNSFVVRIFVREAIRSSEKVTIDGPCGKLSAVLETPALKAGEKCPVVIICHGFGGTKDNANEALLAKKVVDSGKMAAIRFDFDCHGESEGEMVDMTVESEIDDVKSVWRWACALPFADRGRIAIAGFSQGGVVA